MTDWQIKENRLKKQRARRLAGFSALFVQTMFLSGCLDGGGSDGQATDPVVVENNVAFIQRPLLFDDGGRLREDRRQQPDEFRPGGRLFLKDRASPGASARDITSGVFASPDFLDDSGQLLYDVKDLDVSYDGTRLVFAMRAPEIQGADDADQPTWNIWEYDTEVSELRRVIESDTRAENGQDIAPVYLPDGRIVFSSTRQRTSRALLLDEGKPQYPALDEEREVEAFVLHVMDSAGENVEQITFNQSHDLDATVLNDGRILFSRWDNAGQTPDNGVNLYHVNPDGTGLNYLYGRHSHDSAGDQGQVQYLRPVELEDRSLLVQLRPFESLRMGALPAVIDVNGFVESNRAVDGGLGEGQTPLVAGANAFGEPGLAGTYGPVSPLFDGSGRFLASWSPCRLVGEAEGVITNCTEGRLGSEQYLPAAPVYGLWILDPMADTLLPVEKGIEGQQFDESVLLKARPLPAFIPRLVPTGEARSLANAGLGIVHIRSVYDFDGRDTSPAGIEALADPSRTPPGNRLRRFIRFEKPVSIPPEDVYDFDNSAFGRSSAQSMREIVGYAPVEPDGSVRVAVPANVALALSVLDEQGQRIDDRHQNWLQVRPGETLDCQGCHTAESEIPHGRPGAGPVSVNPGAPTTGLPFPNTDPALFADMGETMAETLTRINGIRHLSADIIYQDEWTDPENAEKAESFSIAYENLDTPVPVSPACAAEWTSVCRITINYEAHIHPLWNLSRQMVEADGVTVIEDYTCTGCHSETDSSGAARLPAAQLDLGDGPSAENASHFKAYRELLFGDNEQEIVGGILVDRLVDTGTFERDEEGALILDGEGNPIPIFVTIPVPAPMNTLGSRASVRFMGQFRASGSHAGFLSDPELKLIAEWLDLGGQYFNNPFDAPED
jgi:hypothetical protein